MYFGSDESLAGESAGARLGRRRAAARRCAWCTSRVTSPWRPAAPGSRRGCPAPRTCRSTARTCPRCSRPSGPSWSRTRRSPTSSPSTPASPAAAVAGQDRRRPARPRSITFDLSPEVVKAIQDKTDRVLRRPAALPAGLPRRRLAVAAADQRQRHRRRQAGAHRPVVRRRHQHRQDRHLRGEQHPLSRRCGAPRTTPPTVSHATVRDANVPFDPPHPPAPDQRDRHDHPAQPPARHRTRFLGRLVPRRPEAGALAPVPRRGRGRRLHRRRARPVRLPAHPPRAAARRARPPRPHPHRRHRRHRTCTAAATQPGRRARPSAVRSLRCWPQWTPRT